MGYIEKNLPIKVLLTQLNKTNLKFFNFNFPVFIIDINAGFFLCMQNYIVSMYKYNILVIKLNQSKYLNLAIFSGMIIAIIK